MRKLGVFSLIFILLISTINSTILFSPITFSQNETQPTTPPVDKCSGATCQPITLTCPDGFVASCTPTCDSSTGSCGTCTPSCSGHEKVPANESTPTPSSGLCGWCGNSCTRVTQQSICPAVLPPKEYLCGEENGVCVKKAVEKFETCPPVQPPRCGPNEISKPKFDDKGCTIGYECEESKEQVHEATCPEIPPPTITCRSDEHLTRTTDDKGCIVGYSCVGSGIPGEIQTQPPQPIECPSAVDKPKCDKGSLVPVFYKGCLISYTCVPEGCRQETDQSGFVRVICKHEKTCPADQQQSELKSRCFTQGGNAVPFHDPSGCEFFDCRFDEREVRPNPFSGHQKCPDSEEIEALVNKCKSTGLTPGVVFEGGCKIVRCSHEARPTCRYTAESEKMRIDNECFSRGLPVVRAIDNDGCAFYRCGEDQRETCERNVPSEAYKKCDSNGGELIVKTNKEGCVVFSQCVSQGDDKNVNVKPIEEVPDATVLLTLALKLKKLKINLEKLSAEAKEIAKYYESTGSLDEERYNRVSVMFDAAADRIDEVRDKLSENADTITKDDLLEIKHDIKYIKEVTLKDILYLMLSNSDDVKETLESSKKISKRQVSTEELEANVKSCGTDGFCFDRAMRSCKPVTFQPEGRHGPLISITGLKDDKCVLRANMQSADMIPPGYSKDSFYMDCAISDYAVGVKGPEDIIPHCEGPMAKFAKQFGGAAEISGGDTFQDVIEKEGGPGGCKTEKECAIYCLDNYDECKQWLKEHPSVGPIPSREELRRFASGKEIERREESRERGQHGFSGPGGCKGPQECERVCRSNPDECLRWCEENPDICPKEKMREGPGEPGRRPGGSREGSRRGEEEPFREPPFPGGGEPERRGEFEQRPGEFKRQPEGVKTCVGCLNNGVCDIGECSECVDCVRGEVAITSQIVRRTR